MGGIIYESIGKPTDEMWELIGGGIGDFNNAIVGHEGGAYIVVVASDSRTSEMISGNISSLQWDWLYISLMFLKPEYRKQGLGSQILSRVEREASSKGAHHAFLDTFSFQARGFYEKQGYSVFGTLENFPSGHTRYYMKKDF